MTSISSKSRAPSEFALQHENEVLKGDRFEFGKNWSSFLSVLDDERIEKAERSLCEMLEVDSLDGKTFLDIGSGSGLFSLAARRLGAKVMSFDFDTNSVACTEELRRRYFADDIDWQVEQGSALDEKYVRSLGKFDIVYSWGVLHHTGKMWEALDNASNCVAPQGKLFIAIYNDTGSQSARWRWIKSTYCKLPGLLKTPFAVIVSWPDETKRFLSFLAQGEPVGYFTHWANYRNARGMNRWHDIIDWVGGFPYEVAGPSKLFEFYKARGFRLIKMKCDNVGLGCNELIFQLEDKVEP